MIQPKPTTRKFYNKWLYKTTMHIPGVAVLRSYKLTDIPSLDFSQFTNRYSSLSKSFANQVDIIKLANFLSDLDTDSWNKRIERETIDIYTNDRGIFDSLNYEFSEVITHAFAPGDQDLENLTTTNSIITKKYPHGKYQFKAYLTPHKVSEEEKVRFIEWLDLQGDRVKITNIVKRWFIATSYNWDRRYMLIEDEATLLMIKLRRADAIGRVYDYIISDK